MKFALIETVADRVLLAELVVQEPVFVVQELAFEVQEPAFVAQNFVARQCSAGTVRRTMDSLKLGLAKYSFAEDHSASETVAAAMAEGHYSAALHCLSGCHTLLHVAVVVNRQIVESAMMSILD